jgi:hypothetical protein
VALGAGRSGCRLAVVEVVLLLLRIVHLEQWGMENEVGRWDRCREEMGVRSFCVVRGNRLARSQSEASLRAQRSLTTV